MTDFTIYHNPRCSKSRVTLNLLEKRGIKPNIVLYLQDMLSINTVKQLIQQLNTNVRSIIRTTESIYKTQHLQNSNLTGDELCAMIVKYPILLQRPIVVHNNRAVIGRPPENVLKLL